MKKARRLLIWLAFFGVVALTFQFGSCGKSQTQEPDASEVKEVVKEISVDISTYERRHKELIRLYNRLEKIRKNNWSYDTEVGCIAQQLYILNLLDMQE